LGEPPDGVLVRDRLLISLDRATRVRLTVVVADAGYGKSTLLRSWVPATNAVWLSLTPAHRQLGVLARDLSDRLSLRVPDLPRDLRMALRSEQGPEAAPREIERASAYASSFAEALGSRVGKPLVLVLDDLHEIDGAGPSVHLIASLIRQAPSRLHVVVTSRYSVPFPIERMRAQGQVLDIGWIDLKFTAEETAELVREILITDDLDLAESINVAVDGWPAGTRLALESIRLKPHGDWLAQVAGIRSPDGPLFPYLMEEVLDKEPPEVRALLETVSLLPGFNRDLCEALGLDATALPSISRRHLYIDVSSGPLLRLSPLVRELVERPDKERFTGVIRSASRWYRQHAYYREALACLVQVEDWEAAVDLLADAGEMLIASGASSLVVKACRNIDPRSELIDRLEGEAHQVLGDWDAALECFARAGVGGTSPGIAWRVGLIHYMRGSPLEALDAFDVVAVDVEDPEMPLVLAWAAAALWILGRFEDCRSRADAAMSAAQKAGDHRALAAAHTVAAMVAAADGDRSGNEHHYLKALDQAEEANDALQIIRIRVNRGSRHLEEGSYLEAVAELDEALRFADLTGFATLAGMAVLNRGQAYLGLGRVDEAISDLERSRRTFEATGSGFLALALVHLGTFYRIRGDLAIARAHLTEALSIAEKSGDVQALVPCLAELARVVVQDEPELAGELSARALAFDRGLSRVGALLAGGVVAARRGDRVRALELMNSASELARTRHDLAGLAESLELTGQIESDARLRISALSEARSIYLRLGNAIGAARTERDLAVLDERSNAVARLKAAHRRLAELGARTDAKLAKGLLNEAERQLLPKLAVITMGGFRVERRGALVPLAEWQSRKARDLLKVLIARRGRPAHRDYLIEVLWPDELPSKTANRLSVALTTIRNVLDPDREHEPDHYLVADRTSVGLNLSRIWVDVDVFLCEAEAALRADDTDVIDESLERLRQAEAMYVGDFLDEDPYEDWAVSLREQAKMRYVEVADRLAARAMHAGDHHAAVRYYLRLLERDLYAEDAFLGAIRALVGSGRHGDARRLYSTYCERMAEIGVEAAPLPA